MRGHIQQRGQQSWRVKVFVGRDADGVKRYVERTVRGTRRDAERELARVVVEVGEGRHAAAAPMSFDELLDRWLDVKRRTVEANTMASYEWIARRYVRPALGDRRVASLRALDLDGLYAELHARGLSPRTVRICHTVARQSLEQARREASLLSTQSWFQSLPAVKNNRVAIVDGNQMFNRPGPRLVDAFEFLVGFLNERPEVIPREFPWVHLAH